MNDRRPRPRAAPHEGVILFTVGGFKFAIAADAVKEIRGTSGLREFKTGDLGASSGGGRAPALCHGHLFGPTAKQLPLSIWRN
jgi:hypothetical protein